MRSSKPSTDAKSTATRFGGVLRARATRAARVARTLRHDAWVDLKGTARALERLAIDNVPQRAVDALESALDAFEEPVTVRGTHAEDRDDEDIYD